MRLICAGNRSHRILKFLNTKGCGLEWRDSSIVADGKCPVCRQPLTPKHFIQPEKPQLYRVK